MIKLYLDIDGVLLHTKKPCAAEYAAEFIDYVTANFDCYWLTTHCKGDATTAQTVIDTFAIADELSQKTNLPIIFTSGTDRVIEGIDTDNLLKLSLQEKYFDIKGI